MTYYVATPNINNKATNDKDQTITPIDKLEEVKNEALKATTEKGIYHRRRPDPWNNNNNVYHIVDEALVDKKEEKAEKKDEKEEGYEFGAFHWNMERGAAIALIPLMSTQMIYGAHPVVDGLLGVVLPYHIHMGLDSCITDYVPKRVYPRLHKAANWTLFGTTGLVMWGCYEFNTNDIGITEFMQRLFAA